MEKRIRSTKEKTRLIRDPARISPLLEVIKHIWEKCPDLRLTQLLSNAALSQGWKDKDLFYLEDDKLLTLLTKYHYETFI